MSGVKCSNGSSNESFLVLASSWGTRTRTNCRFDHVTDKSHKLWCFAVCRIHLDSTKSNTNIFACASWSK